MSDDAPSTSIAMRVADHWSRHELVYPSDSLGNAFWPPNDYVPGTGEPAQWRVSTGKGTVYATTTQYRRDAPPHRLALVELSEGFRMLAQLVGDDSEMTIGTPVRVRFTEQMDDAGAYPLFERARKDNE